MADPAGQGFEVAPTRLGGSGGAGRPGRRRRLPILLVILVAIAVPIVAWVGPRIEWRPEVDLSFLRPTPTPVPSPTPRPTPVLSVLPTSLPAITVGVGPHPTEPFPIDVGGVRLLDPETGELGPPFELRGDTDAVFTSPEGGWWCVCFVRVQESDRETVTVEIRRLDPSGRVTLRSTVGEYRSAAPAPSSDFYIRFDLLASADGRIAYLSSGTRTGNEWTVVLERIDLGTGEVVARAEVGRVALPPIPAPTPPPDQGPVENYFAGPYMRMSPDGRRILLWAWIDTFSSGAQQAQNPTGWMIDLDEPAIDGSLGRLTLLGDPLLSRLRTCYWVAWTKDDELAAICWPTGPESPTIDLALIAVNGDELGRAKLIDSNSSWFAEPVLDRANRSVLIWQPGDHLLKRLDLDTFRVEELKVDPTATVVGPSGSGPGGGGPSSGVRPAWATFTSAMNHLYYAPQLLPEPGTNRLFALGILPDTGEGRFNFATSGIWVFDTGRLTLLDRWAPLAAYSSFALSKDGRWLMAAGSFGSDEDGHEANWESSVTVHDASDGRPALQLGRLGRDVQVIQVPP